MLKLDGAMPKVPCAAQQMFQGARSVGGDPGKMTGRLEGRCPPIRKISSSSTVFYKKVFPIFWFGFCAFFVVGAVLAAMQNPADILFVIPAVLMAVFGYVLMRALIFDLVDEVYLDGNQIIVTNRSEVDQFAATNILNVNASLMMNPERITLTLKKPSRFGSEVTFLPTMRFWMFQRHPIARELIELAHREEG